MIGLRLNRGGAWISLRRAEQNHADKTHHSAETLQNHDAIMAEWLMSLSVRTFARGSIDKVASVTTTSVGTPFTYTLTVRNQGPANKPNGQIVTVDDIVPVWYYLNQY
jgi:uncharacterized repeat protein (TIGR01451 family)